MGIKKRWGSNTYIKRNRFQKKAIKRDKEGHYIILKEVNHQEDITLVDIYAPNKGAPNYLRKIGRLQERYKQQHTHHRGF